MKCRRIPCKKRANKVFRTIAKTIICRRIVKWRRAWKNQQVHRKDRLRIIKQKQKGTMVENKSNESDKVTIE